MKNISNKRQNIIAMIPARMGSARLRMKNLALLGGKPLLYYAIKAAREAGIFKRIVINSEDTLFSKIAKRYGVSFYRRPEKWATSRAKSDSVVYNFVKNNPCDIVTWVNPISPLQSGKEIKDITRYFLDKNLDSLITVKNEEVHCMYRKKPVNFKKEGLFARTQDLTPVKPFIYSVMMWRTGKFMREFEKKGHAFFCGKFGTYSVNKATTVIVKRKEDLMLAESLLGAINRKKSYNIKYDKIVKMKNGEPTIGKA